MQRIYGRNQTPNLRKKSGFINYFDDHYLDPASCMIIVLIVTIFIASIMFVAAAPNSNFMYTA